MFKKFILSLTGFCLLNANDINNLNVDLKDNSTPVLNISGKKIPMIPRKYYTYCLEDSKWIQFVSEGHGKNGVYYVNDGLPIQMFSNYQGKSLPVLCD